jgi:hypothetical protein
MSRIFGVSGVSLARKSLHIAWHEILSSPLYNLYGRVEVGRIIAA